ncbi:MAG: type II secretion system ATPase GspE [Gammaproteobacteria bacterium]|nr:type II secretion system ATPase GspE [Gammaproteobacteria bacterium]
MSINVGEILVEAGKLDTEQLERVRGLQAEGRGLLGPLLVQLGFVSERDLCTALAAGLGWPEAVREDYERPTDDDGSVSADFLHQYQAVPLAIGDDGVEVAIADPGDGFVLDALRLAYGRQLHPSIGRISDIQAALARHFPLEQATEIEPGTALSGIDSDADDIAHLRDMASEAPVIRRVNQLISRALELRASDIHIEPFERSVTVRYRIDGALRPAEFAAGIPAAAITSRIKIMADLNIAERRLPQDGRIKLRVEGREVDMRISTVPTMHGESVVMRLLDQGDVALDFAALGFGEAILARFRRLLARPHGILLVTGPTGSGKTTTLYAALSELNTPDKKILTVEDPIEYQLDGVNQIPVRPNIDLTFANALRAILRQDPDVIMIGEMRDVETARIAVQAALTGHKVFSTLHTNDAASSITRLQDMQVDDYLLTSTIDGVLAQRLVRRLCPHCRQPFTPSPEAVAELGLAAIAGQSSPTLYRAQGCEACDHTGYRGRTTILELLIMNEPLRRAIIARADADQLREIAVREGMTDMRIDGLDKALQGLTTIEEVERVVQSVATAD